MRARHPPRECERIAKETVARIARAVLFRYPLRFRARVPVFQRIRSLYLYILRVVRTTVISFIVDVPIPSNRWLLVFDKTQDVIFLAYNVFQLIRD